MSLEPLRVEFALIALVRDEDGQVIDEVQVGQGRAFPRQFDSLPDEIRKAFEQAKRHHGDAVLRETSSTQLSGAVPELPGEQEEPPAA